MPGEF
jgi:hypothetical protein